MSNTVLDAALTTSVGATSLLHAGESVTYTLSFNGNVGLSGSFGIASLVLAGGGVATFASEQGEEITFSYVVDGETSGSQVEATGLDLAGNTLSVQPGTISVPGILLDGEPYAVMAVGSGSSQLLIAANATSNTLDLLGAAGGTFTQAAVLQTGQTPVALATGNLVGSSAPAVVSANEDGTVSVFLPGTGNTLADAASYTVGTSTTPDALAIGDVTGDGLADLIVGTQEGTLSVLVGDGTGTLQAGPSMQLSGWISAVALLPVAGQTASQVAVAELDTNTIDVLNVSASGSLQVLGSLGTGLGPTALAVADLNGDGIADLIVACQGSGLAANGSVEVFIGDGNGGFRHPVEYQTGELSSALVVGNLNGDGKADIAVANPGDDTISLLLGNGDGTFQAARVVNVGFSALSLAMVDTDGGGPELVAANASQSQLAIIPASAFEGSFTQVFTTLDVGALVTADTGLALESATTGTTSITTGSTVVETGTTSTTGGTSTSTTVTGSIDTGTTNPAGSASTSASVTGATGIGTVTTIATTSGAAGGTSGTASMLSTPVSNGSTIYITTPNTTTVTKVGASRVVIDLTTGYNLISSLGEDTVSAGGGWDTVFASGATASVVGGSGHLVFVAGAGSYSVAGGAGSATLYGGAGSDTLAGGTSGNNVLVAGQGNATLMSGNADLMFGGFGNTRFIGSAPGGDLMVGGAGQNTFAMTGGDVAFGGGTLDAFTVGGGGAIIVEGAGRGQVTFGSGAATAFTGSGQDIFTVVAGEGGQDGVVGFKAGDQLVLQGYGNTEVARALASASSGAFGTSLTLNDHTSITLWGVQHLTSSQIATA